ncbi:MAG: sigma-70 family RNA polymerase sigma factor [Robiginitomaculum sp.]|nr:sigma-70 family RNA polymerase sigma factor [Robiginitomaculum sp.]
MMSIEELNAIYLAQRANLCRFVAARLRDEAGAEDVVQDVWMRIEKSKKLEEIENPVGYLFTIAGHLALDIIRQRKRQKAREEKWTDETTTKLDGIATSQEQNAEASLLQAERIIKVRTAIARLPPKSRRAFELHRMQEMSHKEVAAEMGIAVSTVEKHIIRAMRELVQTLRDDVS